ncbi:MAG TPA: HAMP domain-containing sensor histidine kinase [Pararhizobium sp.]|nr:HAMP domain-containing sensor histidine kinase [Pararhizobium sp.]
MRTAFDWRFLKRNRGSITTRLILSLTVATTLLWCGGVAYATYASYRELNEAFDAALREIALRLLPLAQDDLIKRDGDDSRAISRLMSHKETHLSYQLRDRTGKVMLRARDAPNIPYVSAASPGFSTFGNYRLYSQTDPSTGLTITVSEPLHNRLEAVQGSIRAMLWPLIALIPLNILAIWLSVRSAMMPVRRLKKDIASRGSENLAPLDVSDQPTELRPIADAVARLIERLAVALEAERAFAANSAHELRTPLAGALAQTQRLIAEMKGGSLRRRAEDIEAVLKRLSRLSDKLIQLSRVDAGIALAGKAVDLKPVFDIVINDAVAGCGRPERIVHNSEDKAPLVARMDPDAFAMALRNLIDNALTHGAQDGKVEILREGSGTIRVLNEGPVVAPEVIGELTKRFARGRTDGAGSGLGLAIVETIMEQSKGRLSLLSPPEGRKTGFEARLDLPALIPAEGSATVPGRGDIPGSLPS